MQYLEISQLAPDAGDDGYEFKRFPCVQIMVSNPGSVEPISVWALVDTGADYIFVDRSLMITLGARPIAARPVNVVDIGMIFEATVSTPPFLGPSTIQVCGIDLASKGVPYRAVLGRQFLSAFRLDYNPAQGIYRLYPGLVPADRANIV